MLKINQVIPIVLFIECQEKGGLLTVGIDQDDNNKCDGSDMSDNE